MSETTVETGSGNTAPAAAKAPARPASEVLADIERERAALVGSFESLRRDLDEAIDAGARRAKDAGRRAAVIAPAVAGVLAALMTIRWLLRRRARADG